MSLAFYKVIHLFGIALLFTGVGGLCILSISGSDSPKARRLSSIVHGLALVIVLITGFGLLAKLGMGAAGAAAPAPRPATAGLGLEVLAVAKINQGIEAGNADRHHIAAVAPITTVGSAVFDELLAAEADAAVTALAAFDVDLGFVDKLHGCCSFRAAWRASYEKGEWHAIPPKQSGNCRGVQPGGTDGTTETFARSPL